ncbi:disulfide bond formation protein B [Sphingomonas sp. CL5.1]|uniref:disulfide bond formation protein B n=1 Tax=Sphingomonas sp. CL5.1 TaxID=2653203 RepID=UPI00158263BC|nr:disulfide bond formation protein B [Sphingomonas sp. CL5.1]QKS01261.1 disulfide bond formation protein B [Sphingomonas sp. CL5.1]
MNRSQRLARAIALLLPAALLAGAWGSQLIGGLHPCEMCHWQRWPHYAAVVAAALAFVVPGRSVRLTLVAGAAALIAVSGMIGIFHAGVEYHWWQGITACSTSVTGEGISTDEMLRRILAAPVVRCDAAQWRLFGISLAGFNAIFSLGGAGVIAWLLRRRG